MKLSEKIQEALRQQQEINLSDPHVIPAKAPLFAAQDVADYLERIRTAAQAA
jgi:hypothetical protein